MKSLYDFHSECQEFSPGSAHFLPIFRELIKFSGPYTVAHNNRRRSMQSCHFNLLKPYFTRSSGPGPVQSLSSGAAAVPVTHSSSLHEIGYTKELVL